MSIAKRPQHKLTLEFNGSEMVRIYEAAKDEGLSMEAWASAIVAIAAAEQALRLKAALPSRDDAQER